MLGEHRLLMLAAPQKGALGKDELDLNADPTSMVQLVHMEKSQRLVEE